MKFSLALSVLAAVACVVIATSDRPETHHLEKPEHAEWKDEIHEPKVAAGKAAADKALKELQELPEGDKERADADQIIKDREHVVSLVLLAVVSLDKTDNGAFTQADLTKVLGEREQLIEAAGKITLGGSTPATNQPLFQGDGVGVKFVDVLIAHYKTLDEFEAALQYAIDTVNDFEHHEHAKKVIAQLNLHRTPDLGFQKLTDGEQATVNEAFEHPKKSKHAALIEHFPVHSHHLFTTMDKDKELHHYCDIASWILRAEKPNKGADLPKEEEAA